MRHTGHDGETGRFTSVFAASIGRLVGCTLLALLLAGALWGCAGAGAGAAGAGAGEDVPAAAADEQVEEGAAAADDTAAETQDATGAWVVVEERGGTADGDDGLSYAYTSTLDEHGNVLVTEGEGLTEQRTYDADGYCTELVTTFAGVEGADDDVATTTFSYEKDDQGRATTETSSTGLVTRYTYDEQGNLRTKEMGYGSDEGAWKQQSVTTYDANGLVTGVRAEFEDVVVVDEYGYEGGEDERHPAKVTKTEHQEDATGAVVEGSELTATYELTYDDNGNCVRLTCDRDGQLTTTEYVWQYVDDPSTAVRCLSRLREF